MKVLLCDDSVLARKQLSDALKACDASIEIIEAKNGKECVEMYAKNSPDIVFVDIVMPVLDGVSAVKDICSSNPDAVVVIVSSVGTQKELKSAIESGAKDFIQKPFSKEQITEVFNYYLK